MQNLLIARYNSKGHKLSPRVLREGEDARTILENMGFKETGKGWRNRLGFTAEICEINPEKRITPARL